MARALTIGRVAEATGCKVQTIRYYEQIGLLSAPDRSSGNQRQYTEGHVARLAFIRHARELGFPLDAIRELLYLSDRPDGSCSAADAIARDQLTAVEHRIARLEVLRLELVRMIDACSGERVADCRVIQSLADHTLCETDHGKETGILG